MKSYLNYCEHLINDAAKAGDLDAEVTHFGSEWKVAITDGTYTLIADGKTPRKAVKALVKDSLYYIGLTSPFDGLGTERRDAQRKFAKAIRELVSNFDIDVSKVDPHSAFACVLVLQNMRLL